MLLGDGKLMKDTGCKCQQVAPSRVTMRITYPEVRSRTKHSATTEVTGVDVVPEHARPGKPVLGKVHTSESKAQGGYRHCLSVVFFFFLVITSEVNNVLVGCGPTSLGVTVHKIVAAQIDLGHGGSITLVSDEFKY